MVGSSRDEGTVQGAEWFWLSGAILAGGIIGPVLLMFGLARITGSASSLLLNLEGVFTTLMAWFIFKENFDRRIVIGVLFITAGAVMLSWSKDLSLGGVIGTLAIAGACFAWAIDYNLTRKISLSDATIIAMLKGSAAGAINVAIASAAGATWRRTLRRRSQKTHLTWDRMTKLVADWLPPPRILHPWPDQRFAVKHLR